MHQRVLAIEQQATFPPTLESCSKYEKLDALHVKAVQHMDCQCHKLCMGQVPWSPELKAHLSRICLIRALIKQ